MAESSAELVRELREKTGAGFMDCKKALQETDNNLDAAVDFLRKKGLAAAAKKMGRIANDGRIHAYIHGNGKLGVLMEVNCETDFVANTDIFRDLVNNLAMQVAAANPRFLSRDSVPSADLEREKEILRAQVEQSGKKGPLVEKIVDGKLGKFFEENCLMEQRYVKDPDKNIDSLLKEAIARLGENISVRRFARFQLGEQKA